MCARKLNFIINSHNEYEYECYNNMTNVRLTYGVILDDIDLIKKKLSQKVIYELQFFK
jgi:Cdc6-like AAA superfamily ATPase